MIDDWIKEFDKKFTRKSKGGENKGKFMDRWFVRETTTGDLKSFIRSLVASAEQRGREEVIKKMKEFINQLKIVKVHIGEDEFGHYRKIDIDAIVFWLNALSQEGKEGK